MSLCKSRVKIIQRFLLKIELKLICNENVTACSPRVKINAIQNKIFEHKKQFQTSITD